MITASELRKNTDFSHIKPTDTQYLSGGLRDFFLYRDLGVAKATKGKVIAHLVKANKPPENGTGWHFHVADYQIVIMMKGWAKFMYEDKTEQFLELTEILSLFVENHQKYSDMDELKIKEMIRYYYPDVIIENRYVNHMGCSLWNKKKDIQTFLETHPLSHDLYRDYTEVTFTRKVSKQYFNHYIPLSI
jgi:hypothetical protein